MHKNYIEIGGVHYPVTYCDNGIVIIDYPDQKPIDQNNNIELINEFSVLIKDLNIKINNE